MSTLRTGASGENSAGKPGVPLSSEQRGKGALLRPQDISAEAAAAAETSSTPSADRSSSKEVTSNEKCKNGYGKKSCGGIDLIAEVLNPPSTDRVGSASGGVRGNGIIENQATSSSWTSMPTGALYTRNGLGNDTSTNRDITMTGAVLVDGGNPTSSPTRQQPPHTATRVLESDNASDVVHRSKRNSGGDVSIGGGVDILFNYAGLQSSAITPLLDGLSLEDTKNPALGYRNDQIQQQLPRLQEQHKRPFDPEQTIPSTSVLAPPHLAAISSEEVSEAAGGLNAEVFSNGDLDPPNNFNIPTAGLAKRELLPAETLPMPTRHAPVADLAAAREVGEPAVVSLEHLAPPSQRPQSTILAAPSCLQPPPQLEPPPPKILSSTSPIHAPAGPKRGKRSGRGRGNGGSGKGGRKVDGRGGGGTRGDSESKSTFGGVKSLLPRSTEASKTTRERVQSLGHKPKKEVVRKEVRGKGKRQGKEERNRGRRGKDDRVAVEPGGEAGRGDSGEQLEGLELEEDEETLNSSTGRKIYKGSEHGKVKILFPKMSPWRRNRLRFDEESLWSITDQNTADEISSITLMLPGVSTSTVVIDGTACVGGNAISFASIFDEVWAVEIDEERFALLKGNVKKAVGSTAGCGRRVHFFNADFLSVLEAEKEGIGDKRPVIFLDPPWGGVHYKQHDLVDLLLSETPLAEVCERAAEAGVRHVLLKVPTNFNIKGFRRAVGSSGRVTVHDRNMRKMLLVAVDYDAEPPVSSPPPSPCLSTVSAADRLGDYLRFDMTAGAELDNTAIYLNGDSGNSQSGGGNGGLPWLDSLLLKASRSPTFEQQQLREESVHGLGIKAEEEEEERVPPNGTDTSKGARAAAAAELLGMLHGKLPTVPPPKAGREAGVDLSSHGDINGVIEAPKCSPTVSARMRLKTFLRLDTSGDGEICGQDASDIVVTNSAPQKPDPYIYEQGHGGVAEMTSSLYQEVSIKEGVVEGGGKESAAEDTRRRLKEILGVKL